MFCFVFFSYISLCVICENDVYRWKKEMFRQFYLLFFLRLYSVNSSVLLFLCERLISILWKQEKNGKKNYRISNVFTEGKTIIKGIQKKKKSIKKIYHFTKHVWLKNKNKTNEKKRKKQRINIILIKNNTHVSYQQKTTE